MALPTFIPDLPFLIRQPFLWWMQRVAGSANENLEQMSHPPLPDGWTPPHPYSPFVLSLPEGPDRLQALLYWSRFLDYLHWPGVLRFSSLPDLLYQLAHADYAAASGQMWRFTQRQRGITTAFWRDAMAR